MTDAEVDTAPHRSWRRPVLRSAAVLAVVAAAVLVVALLTGGSRPAAAPPPTSAAAVPSSTTVPLPMAPVGSTLVGTLKAAAPASVIAGGPPVGTVPATWYGYRSALPIIDEVPGWALVRLAQRPNGSTAWVPLGDLTISTTPYRIQIDLATRRLTLYRSDAAIVSFPAGVGTADDPTPTGSFFMTMKATAPSAGYGPFVLVTSDHSDTITDWEGSGDAIIAIHGPIDSLADEEIGTTGAAISHGCVRLHVSDLAQLGVVPAGSPVDVVAG